MPPNIAILIAMLASVTVSIGELTRGTLRLMFFVSFVERSTESTLKLIWPGRMMISAYDQMIANVLLLL